MKNLFFKGHDVRSRVARRGTKTSRERGARELSGIKTILPILLLVGFFYFGGSARAAEIVISEDTTWEKGEVRVIENSMDGLAIMPGAKLTVNPGVIIKLGKNTPILVMGELDVKGSPEEPVIITSLRNDSTGGDTNSDSDLTSPAPGDWFGILANYPDARMSIDYAEISYGGGYDDNPMMIIGTTQADSFSIAHSSLIHNTGFITFNETPLVKINYSNIYFDETSCYEEEGERLCNYPILFYSGAEPLDATNNYWDHPEGPNAEGSGEPGEARGIYIQGNINYEPFLTEPWKPEVPEVLDPVILVPGIMGSYQNLNNWVIDPILHTYDNLIEAMIQSGYELNKDLFLFPYNWRQDNVITAGELKNKIAAVKEITGSNKIDLVAHSMGGLVARSYIQGSDYQYDVDQLIFLGTPHLGAPEDYLVWEGGYFMKYDLLFKGIVELEAVEHQYINMMKYIHEQILSTEQLLPVYDYLQNISGGEWINRIYPVQYPRNEFLENLNVQAGISALKERTNVINIFSHAPETDSTLTKIRVIDDPDIYDSKWPDGYPENLNNGSLNWEILGDGDGTVPTESANSLTGVETIELFNSDHRGIVTLAQKEVISELTGNRPDNYVTGKWSAIKRIFLLRIYSPADFRIIAPDGKRLGKDFLTGEAVNEIDGAFYSGFNSDTEFATILNPIDGEYKIELQGTGEGGEYKLSASVISDEEEIDKEFTGTIAPNQTEEFKLDYTEESENPIGELEPEDTIAPTVVINAPAENIGYLHSEKMNIGFTATDDFSGIATTTIALDGEAISESAVSGQSTTTIDLFYYKTGEHILEIIAEDKAGNVGSSTVKFRVIATPDSVISDMKRLYEMKWIADQTISKILTKEIEEIKWWIKLTDEAKKLILKAIEKTEKNRFLPEKLKIKMIQRFNEELNRLDQENAKKLNIVFDRIERSLQKYLKRNLINQGAYDIIKDDVNYLRGNL
jgi:pimeloyl-ACP methyl ester carboxylesterase